MTDKKNDNSDENKSSDERPQTPGSDGDLGFASDDDARILRNSTSKTNEDAPNSQFIPAEKPKSDDSDSSTKENSSDETSGDPSKPIADTWVPELDGHPTADADQPDDPFKTWVPSDTPTATGLDSPHVPQATDDSESPDQDDPNATWVPSSTPTFQGSENPPASDGSDAEQTRQNNTDEEDDLSVDKTWVPSSTPTVNGITDSEDADPNKTYVPSSTPTVDGIDSPEDVDKTWVPSKTPTHHDFSFDGSTQTAEADSDDPNKTWVPSDTPTANGLDARAGDGDPDGTKDTVVIPEDARTSNTAGTGTVVVDNSDRDTIDPSDSANADTQVIPVPVVDSKTVFSQTIGSRGSSQDDDDWIKEVEANNASDTDVFELPEETLPGQNSRSTQIWSQQSANGLSDSLTIRNAPVAGDRSFEENLKTEQPDYEIIKKLAEGGMGAIYVAKQMSLGRELAIKTLKPLRPSEKKTYQAQGRMSQVQQQRREMFLSEALVTGNLVHPHIIPIHDLCQASDEAPFYSMKRVHGTPWNETIKEMSLEENLEVLHKVCDAMAYAHHNGVVNRDLKPENVMLGEFGEVLVLDWGLAVPSTKGDKARFKSPAAPFGAGTPAYMSPELWTGPAEMIGVWSDIYLLGAILFEAITGEAPHEFPEPDSTSGNTGLWMIIDKVVRKNTIRPTEHKGELMDIAMKAMSGSPKKRYLTVLEFQEAIKEFQKHEESRYLAERAQQSLNVQQKDYQNYQTAAALFEEAQVTWPENSVAREGLRNTRFQYAALAHTKGDYDLGLQVAAEEQGEDFQLLTNKLTKSRRFRNGLKRAMVTAVAAIVCVGTFAAYQAIMIKQKNTEITALYGDKETLEQQKAEAQADKKLAEDAKSKAVADQQLAEEAKAAAVIAQQEALQQKQEAESARAIADKQKAEAEKARLVAESDRKAAKQQQLMAEKASEEAEQKRLLAEKEKAEATKQLALVNVDIEKAEKEKVRADIAVTNSRIASRIRNADYPAALRSVEELLSSFETNKELAKLPKAERDEKIRELEAQQRQLEKRARKTGSPVQAQVISSSGRLIVWGDDAGKLTVWETTSGSLQLSDTPKFTKQLDAPVSALRISEDETMVVAASGSRLHVWIPAEQAFFSLNDHTSKVTSVAMDGRRLLSADEGGNIFGWDIKQKQRLWSMRSSSAIRNLELLSASNIFLYAGSRGGQSADILAYQLPPESAPTDRPTRLGQLRLPRNRNNPPQMLSVSPDESLLIISNSRNGELMVLARVASSKASKDRFPFVHAAALSEDGNTNWIAEVHQRPVNDIRFSKNGNRVATASDDRTVGVWDVSKTGTLTLVQRLEGHGARVNSAGFLDPDGQQVLSASADRFCRLWDVTKYQSYKQEVERIFNLDSIEANSLKPTDLRLSDSTKPNNNNTISSTAPRQRRWIPTRVDSPAGISDESKQPIVINKNRETQRGAINTIVLSKDGSRVVTGAADGTAVIWDAATGKQIKGMSTRANYDSESSSFDEGHEFNVARLRFLPPNGNVLMTTGFDGTLCLWNADTQQSGAGRQELRIPGLGLVNAIANSQDGSLIVTSGGGDDSQRSGSAMIWKTSTLLEETDATPVAILSGYHRSEVSAISVSLNGQRIATGARDGRVAVWDAVTGELIAGGQIHAKNTIVSYLQWMADDSVLSAGFDGRIAISSVQKQSGNSGSAGEQQLKIVRQFKHDRIPVERLSMAPGQDRFVTISVRTDKRTKAIEYELELWNLANDEPLRRIKPAIVGNKTPHTIVAVSWSQNADRLVAVVDNNLHVFDTDTWKVTNVLDAAGLGISDVVFAPKNMNRPGSENIIATFDGTASHLWNLKTRSHIADFRPLFAVKSAAMVELEDTNLLLTGDRAVRIFQADQLQESFGQTLDKISDPHSGVVTDIQFSPVGTSTKHLFVSSGADGSAALWNWNQEVAAASFVRWLQQGDARIVSTCWNSTGSEILLAEQTGTLHLLQADQSKQAKTFQVQASLKIEIASAVFSADDRFLAVAGQLTQSGESSGWVYDFTNADSPELHCTISGGHEAGGIRDIRFLPDSSYLVTGGADGAALIWNWQPSRAAEEPVAAYETYQLLADGKPQAHEASINAIDVSTGTTIATACEDGTAIVWPNPFAR